VAAADPGNSADIAAVSADQRVPQVLVVETALAYYLAAERLEAAIARRLDRMVRQTERLDLHVTISNKAIAIFVRVWVTNTLPLPEASQPAAQAKARERDERFLDALVRRLARGRTLADEVSTEITGDEDRPY
jgi:hypothetical protein